MAYVALKPLMVNGQPREVGEAVPEAETWDNPKAWINQGQIAFIQDSDLGAFQQALRTGADLTRFAPYNKRHHLQGAARRLPQDPSPAAPPHAAALDPAAARRAHPQQHGKRGG